MVSLQALLAACFADTRRRGDCFNQHRIQQAREIGLADENARDLDSVAKDRAFTGGVYDVTEQDRVRRFQLYNGARHELTRRNNANARLRDVRDVAFGRAFIGCEIRQRGWEMCRNALVEAPIHERNIGVFKPVL